MKPIEIHHHIFLHGDAESQGKLDRILELLTQVKHMEETQMADLDTILADVTEEGTKIDGLSTLTAGLKQQLADALAGTVLPPAVQAKVDAVFNGVEANKAKVIAAIDANTPAA